MRETWKSIRTQSNAAESANKTEKKTSFLRKQTGFLKGMRNNVTYLSLTITTIYINQHSKIKYSIWLTTLEGSAQGQLTVIFFGGGEPNHEPIRGTFIKIIAKLPEEKRWYQLYINKC